jgi:hypothetical protein
LIFVAWQLCVGQYLLAALLLLALLEVLLLLVLLLPSGATCLYVVV